MNRRDILNTKREAILRLAETHGMRNLRLFGSVARGEADEGSDIDILVEVEKGRTFLDLVAFWQDVQDLLGCAVDVITDGGINSYLCETIYAEAIPL